MQKQGFDLLTLNNRDKIKDFIQQTIPSTSIVGLDKSLSTGELGINNCLSEKGITFYYSWDGVHNTRSLDSFEELPTPDFFFTLGTISGNKELFISSRISDIESFPKNLIVFVI